jgi:hypothetical protein
MDPLARNPPLRAQMKLHVHFVRNVGEHLGYGT